MGRPVLDNTSARRLFLHRHGLCQNAKSLADIFDRLTFVQVDSINTVARAHHMILHARMPSYRQPQLAGFLQRDRGAFEHWTHDASMVRMADYPFWKLRFQRSAVRLQDQWAKHRREGFAEVVPKVLEQVTRNGPTCSADVGVGEKRSSGGWWDWHPSKTALEYLWHSGQLAVCHRHNFRKYYDLPARVIPQHLLDHTPSEAETIDWACNRAIDSLGFATTGEIAAFFAKISPAEAKGWAVQALADGRLIEIDVEGADGSARTALARPDVFEEAQAAPKPPGQIRIMSPFDPALRDRKRAERLFGFHYRIEVFVPAAKREYGYYVFPVLEGDRLIGRLDMKADAKSGLLDVTRFWPERSVRLGNARVKKLTTAIERTRRLSGAQETRFDADWLAAPQRQ